MADRKRKVKQAIEESVELSTPKEASVESPKPKAKKAKPAPTTKNFQLNKREKEEAAAPAHPRAGKSQRFRNKELQAGIAAGRAGNPAEAITPVGEPIVGHKKTKNINTIPSNGSSSNTYRAVRPKK